MTGKTDDKSKAGAAKKTLSDGDIATYARRTGPSGGRPGTDVDTHSDADTAPKATDKDTAPSAKAGTDKDS